MVVVIANLFVFGFKFLKFTESKYLSVVTLGFWKIYLWILFRYFCQKIGVLDKPDPYLKNYFKILSPFLFGTIGA